VGWRTLSIRLFTSMQLRSRAMVIGSAATVRSVAERMRQALPQYNIVGAIADDVPMLPLLGDDSARRAFIRKIAEMRVTELVLATEKPVSPALEWVIADCYERGIAIRPLAALYEEVLGWVPVHITPQPLFPIPLWRSGNMPSVYQSFKRWLDLVAALGGLALLVPILPWVALAIVLNSRGPIFYTQERVGKGGRTFRLLKFRSMVADAERAGSAQWATRGDQRITSVGRFLRRTRIDELPQLLNVVMGDMSLVGPRPERPSFVELLAVEIPFYRARLRVLPGLTGWAQINHGYTSSVEDTLMKLQYDLFYIKHQSLALDILILLRTVRVIVTMGGT
ncbi:MAG: sugar transferase, partial [Chloroflexales bacterium]|nr:sugar transferase [Chloroflexales bacterium]